MNFFVQTESEFSPVLPGYYLGDNPFPTPDLKKDDSQPLEVLRQTLYKREIRRLLRVLMKRVGDDQALNPWIIKDSQGGTEHNVSVIGETFRLLIESSEPRIFPVYAPLPLIYENPLAGILRMSLDRMADESFGLCVAAFVFQELQNLSEYEPAPPFEVQDFLKKMEESKGLILEEVLGLKREGEEQSGVGSRESEEQSRVKGQESEGEEVDAAEGAEGKVEKGIEGTKGMEVEAKEAAAEIAEDPQIKRNREWFLTFVDRRAEEAKLGEEVRDTLKAALTEGWEKGREGLLAAGAEKEVLMGLYRLMSRFYRKVIVFIDQLEGWPALDEAEQAAFFGAVAEFNYFASPTAILVFVSYDRALEAMGEKIVKQFQLMNLSLRQAYLNLANINKKEVRRTIVEFLSSDPYREEQKDEVLKKYGELFPFTEEAIDELCERTNCSLLDSLFAARNLLEAGAKKNYARIDGKFVQRNLAAMSG